MDNAVFMPYLLVMAGVTYLIRMLPLAVIRRRVQSPFLQAFLRYMPYAVLGAMTIPAVFTCTGNTVGSLLGLAAGLVPILPDLFAPRLPVWLAVHEDLWTSRRIRIVFDALAAALGDYTRRA